MSKVISEDKLHIKELRARFANKHVITVNDFKTFYQEVFGKINDNTVSWYIYELKRQGHIHHVSRGLYKLNQSSEERDSFSTGPATEPEMSKSLEISISSNPAYMLITMDVMHSSDLDYRQFNQMIEDKLKDLNVALKEVLKTDRAYHLSRGDELQLLVPERLPLDQILLLSLSYLRPFEVRYAVSVGDLEEDIEVKDNTWNMNGPLFWNARDAIDDMDGQIRYESAFVTQFDQADRTIKHFLPLLNTMIGKITEKQWEAIRYDLSGITYESAIEQIGISKTSYYDRLASANLEAIRLAFNGIQQIIQSRRDLG